MVVFRGISAVNLDAKGRIAVPARHRQRLEQEADGKLVVTIETEQRCLLLYPLPQWLIIEEKLSNLPSFDEAARRIQRLLIGHATDLELDSNGRILLPPLLRDYAELEKNVVLIGQGKKLELWGERQWQSQRDTWLQTRLADLPPELRNLSL